MTAIEDVRVDFHGGGSGDALEHLKTGSTS
jgi:hypothetical protein